jgi:hypothetical protein
VVGGGGVENAAACTLYGFSDTGRRGWWHVAIPANKDGLEATRAAGKSGRQGVNGSSGQISAFFQAFNLLSHDYFHVSWLMAVVCMRHPAKSDIHKMKIGIVS